MEHYKNYLKRLHALSQMDIYLITMEREDACHFQRHMEEGQRKERWKQGVNQFTDYLFERKKSENLENKTLIATKRDLTFFSKFIELNGESYFLIVGPFHLKGDNSRFVEKELRQYSMEELEGFLPLFSMVAEPAVTAYEVNYERLEEKELLTLEETICYSDDVAILNNAMFEKNCSTAVKNGDIEFLNDLQEKRFFSEPGHYEVGNGLRKEKNLTLVMNTLSSRAAEEGGVSVVYIRSLCADFAAKIERAKDIVELYQLRREIPQIYCRKVRENRLNRYGTIVRSCISYIETHLSEEIRLNQLAEFSSVSYEYLSRLIKKECGCSFASLLNEIRIRRAQSYLRTGLPVAAAAERTGYKSTAHFCHVFKNMTGMTTTEWCKRNCSK